MRMTILILFSFYLQNIYADGVDLLIKEKGVELRLSPDKKSVQKLQLSNQFTVQLFGLYKSLGKLSSEGERLMESIFADKYLYALKKLNSVTDPKVKDLKKPIELYLLQSLGHHQSFLYKWAKFVSRRKGQAFLKTGLGVALEEIVRPRMIHFFADRGFFLSADLKDKLTKMEGVNSIVNHNLQALKALSESDGALALKWINKLPEDSILRFHLASIALFDYASKGMLGASGKLIKEVVGPWIKKSDNVEEIAFYYITLARLLYQAGALEQSKYFYSLVPENSQYFLSSRVEPLWINLRERNFSQVKGELASLELKVFDEQFYPEIHLLSAMANVMLCKFPESKAAIDRFASVNKHWLKVIKREISSKNPEIVNETFAIINLKRALESLSKEENLLKEQQISFDPKSFAANRSSIAGALVKLARVQWHNRRKMLETALYRMKFIRIELLGRMRSLAENEKQKEGQDTLKIYSAGRLKGDQLSFPSDGTFWGDELFKVSVRTKDLCL